MATSEFFSAIDRGKAHQNIHKAKVRSAGLHIDAQLSAIPQLKIEIATFDFGSWVHKIGLGSLDFINIIEGDSRKFPKPLSHEVGLGKHKPITC
ncbi:MAG TPA: hypothetical protein VMX38_13585 [Verrucomicrobiae bacterium]|nr:hypothetical protein [Verrucomicrobiae bacterium]